MEIDIERVRSLMPKDQVSIMISHAKYKVIAANSQTAKLVMADPRKVKGDKYKRITDIGIRSAPYRNLLALLSYLSDTLYPPEENKVDEIPVVNESELK